MSTARQRDGAAPLAVVALGLTAALSTACADRAPPAMWPEPPPPVLAEPLGQGPDDPWHAEGEGAKAPEGPLPGGETAEGEAAEDEASEDEAPATEQGATGGSEVAPGAAAPEPPAPAPEGERAEGALAARGTVGRPRGRTHPPASFPSPRRPT